MVKVILDKQELKWMKVCGYTNDDIRIFKSKVQSNAHQTIYSMKPVQMKYRL
jgi:hypothetical protein